jgi:D-aspartate ligase
LIEPRALIVSDKEVGSNWLGIARSLRKEGVHVIRLAPKGCHGSKCCSTVISPCVTEEHKFLEFLIKLGKKRIRKDVLFPSTDNSLILISKNKEKLKDYFEPVVADWEVVTKIVDKSKTYDSAKKLGIPVPETYVPSDTDEAKRIAKEINYPCLLKPAYSHIFSWKLKTKLLHVNSEKELIKKYVKLTNLGHKLMVQEEIPGNDHQIYNFGSVFNKNSEPLVISIGRKLRQYPPHFGVGSFTESVWNQDIADLGVHLLKGIKFYGVAGVEFKKNCRTGEFKLLDINGRSWAWNYLATFSGANLSYIAYKDALGEKQEPLTNYVPSYELGIKWIDLKLDFLSMIKMRKEKTITFKKWLNTILHGKKTFDIMSFDDLYPFISDILSEIKNASLLSWLTTERH